MKPLRILNIEDSERDHELFRRHMTGSGIDLTLQRVDTAPAMEKALRSDNWDAIICDYSMPRFSAPEALNLLRQLGLDIPFIIISGTVGEDEAVRALKAGASDYLMKDNLARLIPAVEREIQDAENRRARRHAEEEQKRLDAELYRERERISNIVATVPGVVWEVWGEPQSSPRRLDFVSEYVETLLGYSVREWLKTPDFWLSIVHPDDRERVKQTAEDNYARGEGWRMEFRWVAKEGRHVWVESQSVVIRNEAGEPIGLRGVSIDISERKQAEMTLRESEARFRSLFESIPQPLWVYDLETLRFSKVNDAAVEYYGYSRDEFMAMTIKDIRLPEHLPRLLERVKAPDAGKGYEGVWQHLKKDGTLIDVEISVHDLQFPDGKSRLVLANDVTESNRAEQNLIKSEERYRDLVENAHDIIYSHDLEGNYTSINKAGELITGYSREEALAMNITQTIAPEFVEKAREMIAAKLEGEEGTAYELEVLAKDGHRIAVEVNTKLILHDDIPVGVQGIARDITARKRLEEQLLQAQKLESVGRLAGGIAHDFNNMLTAINGYSDLTLRQLAEDHPLRKNLEEIKKAGERSALLTNQLLAFSRRQLLQPEVFYLNDVIRDTTQMLQRVIGEDVELVTVLNPAVGSVKADPGQLAQIIMNLAVNARDAMPNGGKLVIETANGFVDTDFTQPHPGLLPGAYVRLTVSDTGIGIKEADQAHIFEPFYTTKEVGKGTGLGLATVYGIVKQSGGSIIVKSEFGSGATFELYLPRVMEKSPVPAKTVSSGHLLKGPETILLVEDEELVRSLLRQLLEACGYRVIEAEDGPSALSICANLTEKLDLLITDVVMPQMGGRELAEKLNEILPELPVLFTSGYTDDIVVRDSVLDADVNFIQKPFTVESVSKKVRELLDMKE